jgi:hypothetical protein
MEALHEALHRVPAIFPIASTRASAKYTPYIHLGSHLIFYPSLHPPYLGRHQNDSQQTTVAGARRPSPELDDRQSQTTVVRARRLSPEPDDRRQSWTTVVRARRPSSELDDRRQSWTTVAGAR